MQHHLEQHLWKARAKKTKVVAELTTTDGEYFVGVNVESSCHTLSICAERAAIIHAVTNIGSNFEILCMDIYAEKKGIPIQIVPCGSCLQLIREFGTPDTKIGSRTLAEWLPYPYL